MHFPERPSLYIQKLDIQSNKVNPTKSIIFVDLSYIPLGPLPDMACLPFAILHYEVY